MPLGKKLPKLSTLAKSIVSAIPTISTHIPTPRMPRLHIGPRFPSMTSKRGYPRGLTNPNARQSIPATARMTIRQERTFQRRPTRGRRGPRQVYYGEPYLELRAAQDVLGTLPERIVIQELRRRQEMFDFQSALTGGKIVLNGITVDILIFSRTPNIGLDILSDWNMSEMSETNLIALKTAQLEAQGIRYASLDPEADIYPSAMRLEQRLDEILGQQVTDFSQNAVVNPGANLGLVPNAVLPNENGPDSPLKVEDEPMVYKALQDLQSQVAALSVHADNHGKRHQSSGADTPVIMPSSQNMPRMLKNASGGLLPRGSVVIMDTTIATDDSFTTTTTAGNINAVGVLLEDILSGAFGLVAFGGFVEYVRVASGTTRYQYLQTSTVAGIAGGSNTASKGTFAQAISNRDTTTLTTKALLGRSPVGGTTGGVSIYGDGSDGTVTITVNTTLTSDKQYANLTVNTGVTLTTGGYRIFVSTKLTLTGTIAYNGSAGGVGDVGVNAGTGAAIGGVAGVVLAVGTLGGTVAGIGGGNGSASATGAGQVGQNGLAGVNVTNSIGGAVGAVGGASGAGGSGLGGAGGAGANAGAGGTRTVLTAIFRTMVNLILFRGVDTTGLLIPKASGGGGGGAGGGSGGGNGVDFGAGGGGGGGSGSNGGPILVVAFEIVGVGNITATGGVGGNAGVGGSPTGAQANTGGGGGGGGGAGGSGGIVVLIYSLTSWTGALSALGGAGGALAGGGTGNGTGANGSAGTVGLTGVAGVTLSLADVS